MGGLIERCWNRWYADKFRHLVINFEVLSERISIGSAFEDGQLTRLTTLHHLITWQKGSLVTVIELSELLSDIESDNIQTIE